MGQWLPGALPPLISKHRSNRLCTSPFASRPSRSPTIAPSARLRWAASHDPLTGLANRAEFARRLDEAADGELVLLYIDLDDFKPINDAYGHPVGDIVLKEVGRRIADVIGPDDTVGRLGGDEFAVVCAGTSDPVHGRADRRRIVRADRCRFSPTACG